MNDSEKTVKIPANKKISISLITRLGLFTAIAVALCYVPGFSMLPVVSFIKYEFSDLPILFAAFAFGTLPGLCVAFLTVLISFLVGQEGGGPYGALMHFIAIGAYALTSGLIYRRKKTIVGAVIAMVAGIIAMTAVMIPANLLITPIYTGAPVSVIRGLLLPGIIPVNLIKGAITAVIIFFSYKRIKKLLNKIL